MSTQIPESNESAGMLEKITAIAKEHFEGARSSHRWDHTLRVCRLSRHIAEKEGADPEIVQPAALLHDIARSKEDRSKGSLCHAEEGAKMAGEILKDLGMSQQQVEAVVHCIESHRYRDERQPETLEAKVLFDADKLDSIGAVGIARAFLFAGETGARLHDKDVDPRRTRPYTLEDTAYREYLVKLRWIKDRVLTPTGKKMAEDRHHFMVDFFERLNQEYDGWV